MSYETWTALNNASIVGILIIPIVLAVVVFLRQRRSRSPDGKASGRPLVWSSAMLVGSLIALLLVWGLALVERFPEYASRRSAEHVASERRGEANIVANAVGSWRPNNPNRSDYFTFTEDTYSSVNPEFNTTISFRYRVLRREGECMRIETTGSEVIQDGRVTQRSSRTQDPFIVCVDPETDQMLMSFDGDRGDVFFTRMKQ